MRKYKSFNNYQTKEELFEKLGYKTYQPKIGSLGRAIMEASKHHRSISWLKKQLDVYFNKLRQQKGKECTKTKQQQ